MHRAEIARQTDVSRATISTIISGLLDQGVVVPVSVPASSDLDGRVRELVALNPNIGVAAGVGFADGRVAVHLRDLEHRELATRSALLQDAPVLDRVQAAAELLDDTLAAHGLARGDLLGLGVGVTDRTWAIAEFEQAFGDHFERPVWVEESPRLEAVAEYLWGAGGRVQTMLHLSLSEEITALLVTGGTLHRGASGAAGDFGHVSVDFEGAVCPCGNRGCLVHKVSTPAVLRDLRPLLGENAVIADVLSAARSGDRACLMLLEDVGTLLGRALANLCTLLDPGRIVVSGPLSSLGDLFLNPVRTAIVRRASRPSAAETQVVPADFAVGAEPGAHGGAALVLQEAPLVASVLRGLGD